MPQADFQELFKEIMADGMNGGAIEVDDDNVDEACIGQSRFAWLEIVMFIAFHGHLRKGPFLPTPTDS